MRILSIRAPLIAGLCVCTTGLTRPASASERVTPTPNTESTAGFGEEILHQGEVYQRAAICLSEELTFGKDGDYALTPGYYFRTGESDSWETFSPADGPDAGRVKKAAGAITLQGSFLYSNDGKTIAVITNFYQAINAKAKGITRTTWPSLSTESIQRFIVYGGMNGTKIRLAYREILNNIVRPSRNIFVEYDLDDSKVILIKGARIEVIEASNESIRYRVIQSFNSKE